MKRLLDLLTLLATAPVVLPVLVCIAAAVRIQLGSPILFTQLRCGLHGQVFLLYKFRTMTDARDSNGQLLPDEERLVPFGRMLRRLSLDELPSLFNLLKGDITLVGPRPLMAEYRDLYTPEQARRHEVVPGITGWAQVNGRNALGWEAKFALDVWYVDHRSLWLDIRILLMTLRNVVGGHGVSAADSATMPRFTGSVAREGNGRGSGSSAARR